MKSKAVTGGLSKSIYFKIIAVLITVSFLYLISIAAIYRYCNWYFQNVFTDNSAVLGNQITRNVESTLKTVEQRSFTALELSNKLGSSLDRVNKSGGVGLETGIFYTQLNNALDSCFAGSLRINWMSVVDLNNRVCITRNSKKTPPDSAFILELASRYGNRVRTNYGSIIWVHGSDSIYFMRSVFNKNTLRFSGYFIAEVELSVLDSVFADLDFKKLGNFVIYDEEGIALYATNEVPERFKSLYDTSGPDSDYKYTSVLYDISYNHLKLVHYINLEEKNRQFYGAFRLYMWLGGVVIIFVFLFSFAVLGNTAKNLLYLLEYLDEIAGGNFDAGCPVQTEDEIGVIAGYARKMAKKIELLLKQAAEAEKLKQQSQYQLLQARYNTLQSQVNPHFLFNILQSINGIAQIHGDSTVSELICRLASFFRCNLNRTYRFCRLMEELDYIDNYLALNQGIYGDRLNVIYTIEGGIEKAYIPTHIMQPIIENSLVHGMENKIGTCTIEINIISRSDILIIQMSDDGEGIPKERLETLLLEPKSVEKRIGLFNVNERIQLLYGKEYGLSIESEYKKGTKVTISLPLRFSEAI
ncbi:sensor histidine kinase [Lacrimispora sp.]|uniref:sensor histidine kinase n=1 Tax=Lacrimispora sp. TaxID=2719234 RepID=UPI0028A26115|nr:histidine kinase [Lacrimispora sp.]